MLPPSPMRSEVDVIIPCYNAESSLQRALDSVFRQTFQDFRVFAVDDGSTDGTRHVLEQNNERCTVVSQPNSGPAAARNRALRMSDSPFVAFLDADDEWKPQKLQQQIDALKRDESLALVCTGCDVCDGTRRSTARIPSHRFPSAGRLFTHLARECFVYTPTVVVRRRCLEIAGFFNESLAACEDFNLWLRIAARWNIAILPDALAVNHKRSGSISLTIPPEARLQQGIASLEHVRSSCPSLSAVESRALRHALADRYYFHGSYLLSTGSKKAACLSLISALRFRRLHWRAWAKLGLGLAPIRLSPSLAKQTRDSNATDRSVSLHTARNIPGA